MTSGAKPVLNSTQVTIALMPLREAAPDPGVLGGKAAMLARLAQEGFPVPDGFVVPVAACAGILSGGGLGMDAAPEQVQRVPLADGVRAAIADALERLGDGAVAVRSSGTAEDAPGASFAGQYESVLSVGGADAVCAAVRTCLASSFDPRVAAYRGRAGEASVPGMAVLVQRMVDADAAGVAFSANPVSGEREERLVSAVRGLGDRLVAGEATADEWRVRGNDVECLVAYEHAITAEQAREVAELAADLERRLGSPQDIEWAIAGGRLHLLQSRPITALPQPPAFEVPAGATLLKDAGHYPEQVTPFGFSVYTPALETGIREMCATFGLMIQQLEQYCVGGEVYGRPVPVGGKEGPAPPWWVLAILARVIPPLRRRLAAARHSIRSGLLDSLPERWEREWRDEFRETAERLRATQLGDLSDPALERHLDDAIEHLRHGQRVHFQLFIPYCVGVYELVATCRELLEWETLEALELVAGLSDASSEPARMLASLADQVRERPAARLAVAQPAADLGARLRAADPEIADALADYCDRYGWRATGYDPGARMLFERPELIAGLLRDAVTAGPSADLARELAERRAAAEARARARLDARPRSERERFDEVLAAAQRVYPLREDNIFWTDNIPCGLIRWIALEIGRRLAVRGLLRQPSDIVFLQVEEARGALRGRADVDLAGAIARRRSEWAWVAGHPGPAYLGEPPSPPPDIRGLPPEARRTNGAIMWFMEQELSVATAAPEGELRGVPGSPGRFTGPARVILSEAEFDRLRPGEVLVCPIATPVWSVLFASAGALVTDGGGALSHAAIVAREHGIPAVLGMRTATIDLKDGQIVTVDGSRGMVEVG